MENRTIRKVETITAHPGLWGWLRHLKYIYVAGASKSNFFLGGGGARTWGDRDGIAGVQGAGAAPG